MISNILKGEKCFMINIAIDGPTGSGKGALADGLAEKFNFIHLDTGAIFRGFAYGILNSGYSDPTKEEIEKILPSLNLKVKFEEGKQKIILNNDDITKWLRAEQISKLSSKISVYPIIREKFLEIVQEFASCNNCIIDGRDITSVVLPNADYKLFLMASEEVRAKRRYEENLSKNISCTYEEVLANLKERDYRDSHREIAPLKVVSDATIVDNSELSIKQTVDLCYNLIVEKLKNKGEK